MTVYRSAALTASPPSFYGNIGDLKLPIIGYTICPSIFPNSSNSPSADESETSNFPAANLLNAATHLRWATGNTGDDIYLDITGLGSFTNYVAFAGHNFAGFIITIYGLTSGSPPNLFQIFEPTTVDRNIPILFEFQRDAYTQIRVQISGNGVRTASILYAGDLLRMERGVKVDVDHGLINQSQRTDVISGFSESGNFLGRLVRNQIFETKYEFSNITDDFYTSDDSDKALWAFVRFLAPQYPFFINWAPQDYEESLGFVWLINNPAPTMNPVTRRWSLTLEVRGYASGI